MSEQNRQNSPHILLVEQNSDYYSIFSCIPTKPKSLFYKGNIALLDCSMRIAIVGPRKMSSYAEKILHHLFDLLIKYKQGGRDALVISGGAEGVDEYAHLLAIENGLSTICVLGGGIGWYEKSSKRALVEKILTNGGNMHGGPQIHTGGNGLILTEYDNQAVPTYYTYPQRNRIIAGLSHMVFLPEAGEKSGALLTVGYANKAKIPVYAPMQDIYNVQSLGSNRGIVAGKILPVVDMQEMLGTYFGPCGFMETHVGIGEKRALRNSQNASSQTELSQDMLRESLINDMQKKLGL